MPMFRTELQPGDLGAIIRLHGLVYARDHDWDITFEAYVAETLVAYVRAMERTRARIWIAERDGELIGCIGIVETTPGTAQLRWFLVHPNAQGQGLGRRLIEEALAYCRELGAERVFLWTTSELEAAARLYRAAGFRLVQETPGLGWGSPVVEQRYELELPAAP